MPDAPLTPDKRTLDIDPEGIAAPPRAAFVELGLFSCFSFLRGASDAVDLALTAHAHGYDAVGIADVNSMAGVVRLHTEAKTLKLRPVIGCRIETTCGLAFLAYPEDRAAYGRLCRLISAGRMQTPDGAWQDKGVCQITLAMLADHAEGVQLILLPPDDLAARFTIQVPSNVVPFQDFVSRRDAEKKGDAEVSSVPKALSPSVTQPSVAPVEEGGGCAASGTSPRLPSPSASLRETTSFTASLDALLTHLTRQVPTLRHIAAAYLYRGDDIARIERLDSLARAHGLSLLATNDVHYHAPERRALQDVMTAIRHKTTVAAAGHLLHPNAERHLKSPAAMQRLFARWPHAITAAREVADRCQFSLDELR